MRWPEQWKIEHWWRGSRWLLGRLAIFVASFLFGLGAFLSGVGVSERPALVGADLATKVYYTLGLFVMGGVDLGVPVGGPAIARVLLWIAYFLSPTITALAIAEGFLRAINPDWFRIRRVRDHIVIAGCGELALLYLARLREVDPRTSVFVIERDAESPRLDVVRRRYRARVLIADIRGETILDLVNLDRAAKVFLFTGDDLSNLEACARILRAWPRLARRVVVHVADLHLMRVVAESGAFEGAEIFNSHHVAASHLVHTHLMTHFRDTPGRDRLVLAGFGRFGQTVLAEIERNLGQSLEQVVVIDLEADQRMRVFAEHHAYERESRCVVLQGNMEDPSLWQTIRGMLGESKVRPVFVLGSDQDAVNLRVALWLSTRFPDASIFVRSFHHSTVADQIARHCSFEVESVAELVAGSMREEWFDVRREHAPDPEGYEIVDARTGALTHRHFRAVTRREWQRSLRTRTPISAILIEIERLEEIERSLGAPMAAEIVRGASAFLRENVRRGDSVGAAPGNRLSILMPGSSEACVLAAATRLARQIRAEPIETSGGPVGVTLRTGCAVSGVACADAEALLESAREALTKQGA